MPEVTDISLVTYLGDKRFPRGMRNNNPGNIRYNKKINWKGKISKERSTDRSFEQFEKYWYGIRALIIILRTYYFKHNLTTIEKIVNRFAPPVENETESYVSKVSKEAGFRARDPFIWDRQNVNLLVRAIARHENGRDPLITENIFAMAWLDLID